MDRIKGQKQQTGIKFEKTQILKKVRQFLISLCVFYFLFSYSSLISVQLFDYTIDRKYMLLLCTGILVFLAMSSGLMSSSPVEMADIHDDFQRRNRDDLGWGFELSEKKASASEDEWSSKNSESALVVGGSRDHLQRAFELSEKNAAALEDEVVLGSSKNSESALIVLESSKNSESSLVVLGSFKNSESALVVGGRGGESTFLPESTVVAEDEEGSTEELNQKCEDFIKKFKHRIKTEALQQKVVV